MDICAYMHRVHLMATGNNDPLIIVGLRKNAKYFIIPQLIVK